MTEKYTAYTLIDITNTKKSNPRTSDTLKYNQQQNLNTLIQLIGLRSQPLEYSVNQLEAQDLAEYHFGNQFKGLHTVWRFEFVTEHSQVYMFDNDNVYFLKEDCDGAAFTPCLDETVNFITSNFETKHPEKLNIYFSKYE